jgi:hypothetical protein
LLFDGPNRGGLHRRRRHRLNESRHRRSSDINDGDDGDIRLKPKNATENRKENEWGVFSAVSLALV